MALLINIGTVEHVEKSISKELKHGKEYTESVGRKETSKYTGRWEDLLAVLDSAAKDDESLGVTLELERLPGGIGELTITQEQFAIPPKEEEDEEDGEQEAELGTEAAPCYTSNSSLVQVSILAHPKLQNMSKTEVAALKEMIDGASENSFFSDPESPTTQRLIKDCIKSPQAKTAFRYISRGVTAYLDVSVETTARWKGRSNPYKAGEIVEVAPGGFPSGSDRNFLCTGAGLEKNGKETWCSASFRMSCAGGWDKELYS